MSLAQVLAQRPIARKPMAEQALGLRGLIDSELKKKALDIALQRQDIAVPESPVTDGRPPLQLPLNDIEGVDIVAPPSPVTDGVAPERLPGQDDITSHPVGIKNKVLEELMSRPYSTKEVEAYHGSGEPFDDFDDSKRGSVTGAKSAEKAFWFTDNEKVAKNYAVYAAESGVVNKKLKEAEQAEKIAQRTGRNEDWDRYDKLLGEAEALDTYEKAQERRQRATVKKFMLDADLYEVDAGGKTPQELSEEGDIDSWLNKQIREAKRQGKEGVEIKNLDDTVNLNEKPSTHYAIFDKSKISKIQQTLSKRPLGEPTRQKGEGVSKMSLEDDAKKFDSAEEFVKEAFRNPMEVAKKTDIKPYYHTTTKENIEKIDKEGFKSALGERSKGMTKGKGVWLYDDYSKAYDFGEIDQFGEEGGRVIQTAIDGKIKNMELEEDGNTRHIIDLAGDAKMIKKLKDEGYVGITGTEVLFSRGKSLPRKTRTTFVFEPSAIKTKQQLTDIYNKAKKDLSNRKVK